MDFRVGEDDVPSSIDHRDRVPRTFRRPFQEGDAERHVQLTGELPKPCDEGILQRDGPPVPGIRALGIVSLERVADVPHLGKQGEIDVLVLGSTAEPLGLIEVCRLIDAERRHLEHANTKAHRASSLSPHAWTEGYEEALSSSGARVCYVTGTEPCGEVWSQTPSAHKSGGHPLIVPRPERFKTATRRGAYP